MAVPAAALVATAMPTLERYASHYERYNGPIGLRGANQTTHTAEVRFPDGAALAVVKAFPVGEKGWLNEAVAWTVGRALGIPVPPKAMLLAVAPSELAAATDPELAIAHRHWAASGPIVMWCASRLDVKPPQNVWRMNWEAAVIKGASGQRLAAFDGWFGNCDRIAENAPYWVSTRRWTNT
jgi:hypothetical protein